MIIRGLCQCLQIGQRVDRSSFYARFYSVMHAMEAEQTEHHPQEQQHTDSAKNNSEHAPPPTKRKLKRDLKDIPASPAQKTRPSPRFTPSTALEEGLGSASYVLKFLDQTVERCKRELSAAHVARAKHRHMLQEHGNGHGVGDIQHVQREIERLESILADNHLVDSVSHKPNVAVPRITSHPARARELDNALHDLLRLPIEGQLTRLADLLLHTRIAPTIKTFNIMITRLTRLRQNAAAWCIIRTMLRQKYAPDEYTLSAILNLCIVTGNRSDFSKILFAARAQRRIEKRVQQRRGRHGRSLVLLGTIIKGCVKFGTMRRAETYMKLLKSERHKPNLEILTLMLQGYAETGNWTAGVPHLRKLLTLDWDGKALAALLQFCRACQRPQLEAKVRDLALHKGVHVSVEEEEDDDDDDDPAAFRKTKGLDVPNRLKRVSRRDVGAMRPARLARKHAIEAELADLCSGRKKLFTGTRREVLGKWA